MPLLPHMDLPQTTPTRDHPVVTWLTGTHTNTTPPRMTNLPVVTQFTARYVHHKYHTHTIFIYTHYSTPILSSHCNDIVMLNVPEQLLQNKFHNTVHAWLDQQLLCWGHVVSCRLQWGEGHFTHTLCTVRSCMAIFWPHWSFSSGDLGMVHAEDTFWIWILSTP